MTAQDFGVFPRRRTITYRGGGTVESAIDYIWGDQRVKVDPAVDVELRVCPKISHMALSLRFHLDIARQGNKLEEFKKCSLGRVTGE
jgi:hypothetical protein